MANRSSQPRLFRMPDPAPAQRKASGPKGGRLDALSGSLNAAPIVQRLATMVPNRTGMPDKLKSGVEAMSGMSLDHVRVHYNSPRPAQLQAHAFAQGSEIHLAAGQAHHLPHEAWHVVQQAQGRVQPTAQLTGGVAVNNDGALEREADMMGARAATGGVAQRKIGPTQPADGSVGAVVPLPETQAIVQRAKWTQARVKRYQQYLKRRAHHRLRRGKTKPVDKLVRKLRNARLLAGLKDFSMADPPKSGHHAPPLALSNKMKSSFAYGKRNSAREKLRARLYLAGGSKRRARAHGTMHMAESLVGLDRSKGFSEGDDELVKRHLIAHHGLRMGVTGEKIEAASQSKTDREKDVPLPDFEELGTTTKLLYETHGADTEQTEIDYMKDETDSEPDDDFEDKASDSGGESDEEEN